MEAGREEGGAEEYPTDVEYTRNYQAELNPSLLRLLGTLNGFRSPRGEDFDYCELGAGAGITLTAFAAAHPRGRFVGVDFNPEHAAHANALIAEGELSNARFFDRDFADLDKEGLPHFDFIVMHGVYSWIAPEKRRALVAWVGENLKPGGLVYVSYNALPGWAAIEPLRRLMLEATINVGGSRLERARHGLTYATFLRDHGAAYFRNNPLASQMLDVLAKKDARYVAHEYFHANWHAFYFSDVLSELDEHDLHYVGGLPLYTNFRDLTIPPGLMPLFKQIGSRVAFESQRDFALNETFRRDVFVKGRVERADAEARETFATTPFGTLVPRESVRRSVRLADYDMSFVGTIFDALLPILAERAVSARELAREGKIPGFSEEQIAHALRNLAVAGEVVAMQHPTPAAADAKGAFSLPLAFNRATLARAAGNGEGPLLLASPVAGACRRVTREEALELLAVAEGKPGVTVSPSRLRKWVQLGVLETA